MYDSQRDWQLRAAYVVANAKDHQVNQKTVADAQAKQQAALRLNKHGEQAKAMEEYTAVLAARKKRLANERPAPTMLPWWTHKQVSDARARWEAKVGADDAEKDKAKKAADKDTKDTKVAALQTKANAADKALTQAVKDGKTDLTALQHAKLVADDGER